MEAIDKLVGRKTKFAMVIANLFHEPMACLFIWLPFILRKDCESTAFQISLLATLKPIVAIFSFYWSQLTQTFGLRHKVSVLLSGILARVLFLFLPIFQSIHFLLIASTVYFFFSRAGVPSWMEMLKCNLTSDSREKWFSFSSMIGYLEGIILAIGFGFLFDQTIFAWRYLFAFSAVIGMMGVIYQTLVPHQVQEQTVKITFSLSRLIIKPLQDTLSLMRKRKDFALFQWGFMAGGFGIMLANVVCPLFFVDVLNLRHVDYANARYCFMGLGFILFSPFWQKGMQRVSIFGLTLKICFGFVGFIVCLFLSKFHLGFLHLAFFLYGASQAGSHLIWHLSGPHFSGDEDSSTYSSVNLVMVGIRGLIGPALGSILYCKFGPAAVFTLALICCFFGGLLMLKERKSFYTKAQLHLS